MAAGSRQSPVNIETFRAKSDHEALSSKPLSWRYPATASRKLVNPGYCWRVDTDGDGTCESSYAFSGGPIKGFINWNFNHSFYVHVKQLIVGTRVKCDLLQLQKQDYFLVFFNHQYVKNFTMVELSTQVAQLVVRVVSGTSLVRLDLARVDFRRNRVNEEYDVNIFRSDQVVCK